ncbi:hypothetical protein P22_1616 [Propionispora sp. 2/2-37]|uniref:YjbH domain-containing protein n=1 Tax=Propionispora sp. 2/2-37 TaxID=1677858 RepID=UPI0006BB6474|nr:YjbH domain-containing protein [Propionispora sp. 2/2-37]CUH95545.1 hypothetical protein P22_1616 [Propionispora sp. 2/2-37]
MNKIMLPLCTIVILFSSTVTAAPSTSGPTGLINTPSSEILSEGQLSLGYYHLKNQDIKILNIGISPNMEIGVAQYNYDQEPTDTVLNIKYNILKENLLTPGLSAGLEDIAACSERSGYVVMSKQLPLGIKINAGIGNGRFDGAFAGIEATFSPLPLLPTDGDFFPTTTLMAERVGHTTNWGLRMAIVPGVKAEAGRRDHKYYLGANFTI